MGLVASRQSIRAASSLLGPLTKDTSTAITRSLSTFDRAISDGMAALAATSSTAFQAARPTPACLPDSFSKHSNIE